MLYYFNDFTDKGKLYINYPMWELFRHIKTMPDSDFHDLNFNLDKIEEYKKILNVYSSYKNIQ